LPFSATATSGNSRHSPTLAAFPAHLRGPKSHTPLQVPFLPLHVSFLCTALAPPTHQSQGSKGDASQVSQHKSIPALMRFVLIISLEALPLIVEIRRQMFLTPSHQASLTTPPRTIPYFPKSPITALQRNWKYGFVSGIMGPRVPELPVTVVGANQPSTSCGSGTERWATSTQVASAGNGRGAMLGSSGLFGDEDKVRLGRSMATSRGTADARLSMTHHG